MRIIIKTRFIAYLPIFFSKVVSNFDHFSYSRTSFLAKLSSSMTSISENSQTCETKFDKSLFEKQVQLISLKIKSKDCSEFMRAFKDYSWKQPKMKRIVDIPEDQSFKYLLLSEDIRDVSLSELPQHLIEFLTQREAIAAPYTMRIGYDNLAVEEVLKKVLPDGVEIPSSFEQAGLLIVVHPIKYNRYIN